MNAGEQRKHDRSDKEWKFSYAGFVNRTFWECLRWIFTGY